MIFARRIFILLLAASVSRGGEAPVLRGILERLNRTAAGFRSMSAKIRHTTHTAVVNDDATQTGSVTMLRGRGGVEGLIEFTAPEAKTYCFKDRKVEIYTPASKTVQVYDLGKHGDQLDQFLMLGFGTSGAALEKQYRLKARESAKIGEVETARLEMIPKSKEALQYVTRIELWISLKDGYAVQEKLHEPSGDYILVTYSGVKLNPALEPGAIRLKLPRGVEYLYPQK